MGKNDPEIDTADLLQRLTGALELLAQRQATSPDATTADMMIKLTGALERLAEANVAGSKMIADETRRAHRPSNEIVPMRSVFNRRGQTLSGYTKPVLRCPMFMPWQLDNDSLTREEVQLLNLLEAGEFPIKRSDASIVRLQIQIAMNVDNVTPTTVIMNHETAFNNDSHGQMPSLENILRQVLRQSSPAARAAAAAVLSDEEEEAMIAAGELTVSV